MPCRVEPNPFNGSTTLTYELGASAPVKIQLYNHMGKVLGILVNETQSKGTHQVEWNAEGLPAGIYYVQLNAGEHLLTKKILKL